MESLYAKALPPSSASGAEYKGKEPDSHLSPCCAAGR